MIYLMSDGDGNGTRRTRRELDGAGRRGAPTGAPRPLVLYNPVGNNNNNKNNNLV